MANDLSLGKVGVGAAVGSEPTGGGRLPKAEVGSGPSFKDTLRGFEMPAIEGSRLTPATGGLQFSTHAIERMRSRGIAYNPVQLDKLNNAVAKASAKGARDALVILDNSALIVSVKNNKVVTVIDQQALKENVFTNIDSTVFA